MIPQKSIDDAKAALAQAVGKGVPAGGDTGPVRNALGVLAQVRNAGAEDLVVKTIYDKELMKALARGDGMQPLVIDALSPAIEQALLAQLEAAAGNAPLQLLLVRSLGTSHEPAAADALIKLLTNGDAALRADAAQALAQTGDDRAPEAIAAMLKMPASKLTWPDLAAGAGARKPGQLAANPRKMAVAALAATRNPKGFDLLLALATDKDAESVVRDLALLATTDAIVNEKQIAAFVDSVGKMDPAVQRKLLLEPLMGGFTVGGRSVTAPCWSDAHVLGLVVDRAHDPEAFHIDSKGKKVNNWAVVRLAQAVSPRSEAALLKIAQDADVALAGIARQALQEYEDPEIDNQLNK